MSRRSIIALVAVVLDAILIVTRSGGPLPVAITFVLAVWGAWRLIRLLFERTRLIWRLRNRLIVTYVFIAADPDYSLILALVFLAGYILTGEISSYLIANSLDRQNAAIENAATLLAREEPASRISTVQQLTATGIPPFRALVTGGVGFRYPPDADISMPPSGWNDYTGVVYKDDRYYLDGPRDFGANRALILRSLAPEDQALLMRSLGTIQLPLPLGRKNPAGARRSVRIRMRGHRHSYRLQQQRCGRSAAAVQRVRSGSPVGAAHRNGRLGARELTGVVGRGNNHAPFRRVGNYLEQ